MANMQHMDRGTSNGEENSAYMTPSAMQEAPDFLLEGLVFRGKWATKRGLAERLDGLAYLPVPRARYGFGVLGKPECNGFEVFVGGVLDDDAILHVRRK